MDEGYVGWVSKWVVSMIWCYGVVAIGASDYRRASSWLPWCCVYFVSFSLGIGLVWLILVDFIGFTSLGSQVYSSMPGVVGGMLL